ncbi:hypothetical protein CcaCcLH18_12208 [Colletotrichum camelliae]|nr:hypothetical protein CcaCcLH18_12208 [Colletotrichum camelliae]
MSVFFMDHGIEMKESNIYKKHPLQTTTTNFYQKLLHTPPNPHLQPTQITTANMMFTNTAALIILAPMVVAATVESTQKRNPEAAKQYFHVAGDVLDKRTEASE